MEITMMEQIIGAALAALLALGVSAQDRDAK